MPAHLHVEALPAGDALEEDFGLGPSDGSEGSDLGSADGLSEGEGPDSPEPGAAKRAKRGTLQQRRQARAAGAHPLQASFRAAAASLLAKHGLQVRPDPADSHHRLSG